MEIFYYVSLGLILIGLYLIFKRNKNHLIMFPYYSRNAAKDTETTIHFNASTQTSEINQIRSEDILQDYFDKTLAEIRKKHEWQL